MKRWKRTEHYVVEKLRKAGLKCRRNPLSGKAAGHSGADVLHETLYIEVKTRKRSAMNTLFLSTERAAKKERKIPVVVENVNGKYTVTISLSFFLELVKSYVR